MELGKYACRNRYSNTRELTELAEYLSTYRKKLYINLGNTAQTNSDSFFDAGTSDNDKAQQERNAKLMFVYDAAIDVLSDENMISFIKSEKEALMR